MKTRLTKIAPPGAIFLYIPRSFCYTTTMKKNKIREYATTEYYRWLDAAEKAGDSQLIHELEELANDPEELIDAFCGDLRFGTSGIRGIIGAGTNRMNEYVVRRTTQGLANYLNGLTARPNGGAGGHNEDMLQAMNTGYDGSMSTGHGNEIVGFPAPNGNDNPTTNDSTDVTGNGKLLNSTPSIVIAYDTRCKSMVFAEETAKVLRGNGIEVYLFDELATVSLLSYATKTLGCTMGIMITASHNPKIFNGYKVYNSDGYQIVGSVPDDILAEIDKLDFFSDIHTSEDGIKTVPKEIAEGFIEKITSFSLLTSEEDKRILNDLKVVYTPLNGTGCHYVTEVLKRIGYNNLTFVQIQKDPDENFTTCPSPNPEKITAYNEGFKILDEVNGDILLATDPDCDRVGVCLKHNDMKVLLTGNQLGILIMDYLCQKRTPKPNQFVIRSIVSTPLIDRIAEKYGLKVVTTLTGFKYIGEIATALELENKTEDYFYAFEESNGYLIDPFIRDKDGVSAALVTIELAAYYKSQGKDLIERLREINKEFGTCQDKTRNYYFEGPFGKSIMDNIMEHFRQNINVNSATNAGFDRTLGGQRIVKKTDYKDTARTGLPKSNVLEYDLANGTKFIIRPSGTEAKIKVYYFESEASDKLENEIKNIIETFKDL